VEAHELVGNLHAHTTYSDGSGGHLEVAVAALRAGLDFVATTDHNVYVEGVDGYRYLGDRRVLLLAAEEIHDSDRQPQRDHLLAFETRRELATLAPSPQRLIHGIDKAGGLSFLAHPMDPPAPILHEESLGWESWDVEGYTGLEIWNFMSEFRAHLSSWPSAVYFAYRPDLIPTGPNSQTLARWDRLLAEGRRVVGIGGADAHAWPVHLGPLRRIVFPYAYLFRCVGTHVLVSQPLSGEVETDRKMIFDGLRAGRVFVANDHLAPAQGFRFTAQSNRGIHGMGETLESGFGVTLQVRLPQRAEVRLIHAGRVLRRWPTTAYAVAVVSQPGAYRVEASLWANGRTRGWIYSNPIYLTA
jgi:hypothetical protein